MTIDYKDYTAKIRNAMQPFEDMYAPHIAIIDDCMHDRSVLRNFIRAYFNDIPVRTYRDGVHFWDSVTESIFPVKLKAAAMRAIFLDLNMPEMCGRETLKKIRDMPELSHIPVYMMSRNGCEEKIAQVKGMGANDFISKPFDKLALSMLIQKGSFAPVKKAIAV